MSPRSWLTRVLTVAGAAGAAVLLLAGTAAAGPTLSLNPGHRNTTAAEFGDHSCDQIPTNLSLVGQEGWVFVLPHNDATFVKLTLQFKTTDGTIVTVTIPDASDPYPDGITTTNGTSKAWVVLPAGWILLDGSAELSGPTEAQFFNLTHTCIGPSGSPSPSPSVSSSESKSPSSSPSPSTSESTGGGGGGGGGTPSPSPSATTSDPVPVPTGGLPLTGTAIGGIVLTGAAAVGTGGALLAMRRRRADGTPAEEETETPEDEETGTPETTEPAATEPAAKDENAEEEKGVDPAGA